MVKYYPQANKYYVHNSIPTLMLSHIWFGKNKFGSNPKMNLNIIRRVYKLKFNLSVWEWFLTLSDQFKFRSWKTLGQLHLYYTQTLQSTVDMWVVEKLVIELQFIHWSVVKTLCTRYTFFWMSNHTLSPNMAAQLANDLDHIKHCSG